MIRLSGYLIIINKQMQTNVSVELFRYLNDGTMQLGYFLHAPLPMAVVVKFDGELTWNNNFHLILTIDRIRIPMCMLFGI